MNIEFYFEEKTKLKIISKMNYFLNKLKNNYHLKVNFYNDR